MTDLKTDDMSFYKQDNSATETTNKKLNQRTNHILCGVTMFANLHALAGLGNKLDELTPDDMQFEDWAHCILGNPNNYKKWFSLMGVPESDWWPSNPTLYPWLSEYIFNRRTIDFIPAIPTIDDIKSYLNHKIPVGICQKESSGFYHFKAICGYNNTGFLMVDSAPKLSGGKMLYQQPYNTVQDFSKYIILCRG